MRKSNYGMNWETRYLPPDPIIWQGRDDMAFDSCFYQHIRLLNLLEQAPEQTADLTFAIIGFVCDEGIQRDLGRTGAAEGPAAIRQRLAKLPIQKPSIHCYDAGNIVCTDYDLEASQQALGEIVALLLDHRIRPIIIGGGHEVAWGHYQGIAKSYAANKRLGIISFDAHFDLHPLFPSNRSSFNHRFLSKLHKRIAEKRHFDYAITVWDSACQQYSRFI